MAKDKKQRAPLPPASRASSLDALLAESRALRRQMADDLSGEARSSRQIADHESSRRPSDPDEQSA